MKKYNFKGVYVHIYGFDIPLHDKKMYPLYAKCAELDVPVSMQVGHVLEHVAGVDGGDASLAQLHIAERLKMNPAELRLKNIIKP